MRLLWVVLSTLVVPAWAECWTRDDGVEICPQEPAEWILLCWVWLGLLVLAGTFIQYCDYCGSTAKHSVDNESPSDPFQEPLLSRQDRTDQDHRGDQCISIRTQPVYRYLD
jgi:hypothetical protein